jgi:hypothetical protein
MRKKIIIFALITSITMMLSASISNASQGPGEGDWDFNLAPFYLWAINISGDQTIGSMTGF